MHSYPRQPLLISACMIAICVLSAFAKAQEGDAGVESPFDAIGVSSRDMSMGGAAVAFPTDAGSFAWNAGGMVLVDQQCIGFSKTTLFEESQYHYLGYIFPTLTAGTFGLGISHLGTGGIRVYDDVGGIPVQMGTYDYWWAKLSLAYAHSLVSGFSVGFNFDAHRQEFGPYGTNGFGLDAGLHFQAPVENGIFNNFFIGLNVKNIIKPRMKLGTETESLPTLFRAGLAKQFVFMQGNIKWAFLWDYEKHPYKDPVQHLGTEFCWRDVTFLRMGLNDGDLTLGGGIRYRGIQIDYATGQPGNSEILPRSHRFSISLFMGKSLQEKRMSIIEAREREIKSQVQERQESERMKRVQDGIQLGKQYIENNDYFNARLTFSRVLSEDPNNTEAQNYLNMTKDKEEIQQKEREDNLRKESVEEDQKKRDEVFIRERYQEGLQALDERDFNKAIQKWEEAIARDPENIQLRSYIQKARAELEKEVNHLISQANVLIRQENLGEARRVLDQAKNQTENDPSLQARVAMEIRRLDNTVNYINNYQLGRENYEKGNYRAAADYLEKAMQLQPNDEQVRELYRSARARAIGIKKEMNVDVKKQYAEGLRFYSEGRYQDALSSWEKALSMDPQNIKIIESIDVVKRKILQMEP